MCLQGDREDTTQATTGLVGITSELSPGIMKGEVLLTVCPARRFATCPRSAIVALAPVARPSGCPAILRRVIKFFPNFLTNPFNLERLGLHSTRQH